ncbi:MAG: hypothetical protein EOO15_12530 [Chitinophagaceae bacterium]|nr:MAG: hypothetical protein EOO15_12530 [Chitinophagaceae bacterium]
MQAPTSIAGNTISGIDFTSARVPTTVYNAAFVAIDAGMTSNIQSNTDIGAAGGNTIGSLDGSSSIHITMTGIGAPVPNIGIARYSSTDGGSITNNSIGSILQDAGPGVTTTGFTGIAVNYNTVNTVDYLEVTNNVIGGTASGSITNNIAGNAPVYGIHISGAGATVTGNTVRNLLAHHSSGTTSGVAGLVAAALTSARSAIFRNNTIYGLVNDATATGSGYTDGIYVNLVVNIGSVADRNLISGLSGISAGTTFVSGIRIRSGSADLSNNMISLGLYSSGAAFSDAALISGIMDMSSGSNTTINHNSIHIGGVDNNNTESNALYLSSPSGSRTVRDNILMNVRGGTGHHYALQAGPTTPFTSDYNDLYVSGSELVNYGGTTYATLADYQAGSGLDANSISIDPGFLNPAAASTSIDLHVPSANRFLAVGTFTETNDFDGDTRSTLTPTIGADETCVAPTLSYTVLDACPGNNNGSIDLTTTGGTGPFTYAWSSPAPYANTTQDISNLSANTYAVTVTTPGGCTATETGIVVGTAEQGTASIVYNGSPFCGATGTRQVSRTGTAGGTYSAPAGLVINATTGAIDIDASTYGTYTVSYSYGGACTGVATTPVTIAPVGSILFINPLPNQVLCAGQPTNAANFTSSDGLSFTWGNDNTSIGLGASGNGAIPAFTGQNSGTTPQTAIITANATGSNGCRYKAMVFRITVKPLPTVNQPSNQVVCAGATTDPVAFASAVAGTVFSWTNNNTSTGLIAAGTSNIPGFTAVNNTGSTQVSTITVTPYAAACTGAPANFTLTVSPAAGSISYGNNPVFCPSGSANVRHLGSKGGVYSASPAGLSINATTGAINLGASIPNSYTVSYDVAALSGCPGTATTSITINSQAAVATEPNQVYCGGMVTPVTVFSGSAASYSWTNDNTGIGLAASGTGNLPSFTSTNAGPGAQTAYIRVTPNGNGAGICPGKAMVFRITVNFCPPITQSGDTGEGGGASRTVQVSLSPNPAQGPVTVTVNESGSYRLQVLSSQGVPLSHEVLFSGNSCRIDLGSYRPGVYVLQLVNKATGTVTRKMLTKL